MQITKSFSSKFLVSIKGFNLSEFFLLKMTKDINSTSGNDQCWSLYAYARDQSISSDSQNKLGHDHFEPFTMNQLWFRNITKWSEKLV